MGGKQVKLQELAKYNPITVQCHDNPDADAIASGYGLYCYFKDMGKDVSLIYSGRNEISKSNLKMMVEKLAIPISYLQKTQDEIAIIDHHQVEIDNIEMSHILPGIGSCSTIVWKMLLDAGYTVDDDNGLGTALYYGLYTDTNQFSEMRNPLDKDLREGVEYDNSLINQFRNFNLSLDDVIGTAEGEDVVSCN